MHLAIRADGGSEIGFGHLSRTSAIAAAVLESGGEVTYLTTTPEAVDQICPDTVTISELPSRTNPDPVSRWLRDEQPDLVFVDSYAVDTAYQQKIRQQVTVAVLDDDGRHTICADLLINGNLYADSLDYEFVDSPPTQLCGPEYVLLRDNIRALVSEDPPWRPTPERAIVTMGGSDITNQTPTIIAAFDGFDLEVDAIVGPGFSDRQETAISAVAADVSSDVRVIRDPDDLAERMFQADLAVSTSSSTTYELLSVGTPIVSVPVVENQEPIAAALRDHDIATVVEYGGGVDAFRQAIEEYISTPQLRLERQQRGRTLVDGRGTERVADALEECIVS